MAWGAVGAALGQAGGDIAGGLAGSALQNYYGKINTRHARRWLEQMRATAYQTQVADLKAAGLNPALAYIQHPMGAGGAPQAGAPDVNLGGVGQRFASNVRMWRRMGTEQNILENQERASEADAEYATQRAAAEANRVSMIAEEEARIRAERLRANAQESLTRAQAEALGYSFPHLRLGAKLYSGEYGETLRMMEIMSQIGGPVYGAPMAMFGGGAAELRRRWDELKERWREAASPEKVERARQMYKRLGEGVEPGEEKWLWEKGGGLR